MKKYIILIFLAVLPVFSQVMKVPEVIQTQDQWCWAGVSACILGYYGHPAEQCQIAEYTREVADWHDFGSRNCCDYPNGDCNYWNYSFGAKGGIDDIIQHFAGVESQGMYSSMDLNQAQTEIAAHRPFVVRWGWNYVGRHFVLGYGIKDSSIYYMNPWFGEGKKIADYDWIVQDPQQVHTWTHSLKIETNSTGVVQNLAQDCDFKIYPNPAKDEIFISGDKECFVIDAYDI